MSLATLAIIHQLQVECKLELEMLQRELVSRGTGWRDASKEEGMSGVGEEDHFVAGDLARAAEPMAREEGQTQSEVVEDALRGARTACLRKELVDWRIVPDTQTFVPPAE